MSGQIVSTVQHEENEQNEENEEEGRVEETELKVDLLARGHSKMYYRAIPSTYKPLTAYDGKKFKYTYWINPFNGFILREDPEQPPNKRFLLLQTQSGNAYIYYRDDNRSNGRIKVTDLIHAVLFREYRQRINKGTQTLLI